MSADERGPAVLLWPENPDASARTLRAPLETRFGVRLAVVISDSLGRAWRMGTMGSAIGAAGMKPLRDLFVYRPELIGITSRVVLPPRRGRQAAEIRALDLVLAPQPQGVDR